MNVSTSEPFQIVYSIYQHEYLGYLFESFVVQLNEKGTLTLKCQNISSKNADEFSAGLDETDFQLIEWTDSLQQDVIYRKFNNKKISITDFFLKTYDPKKGDKDLQQAIEGYVDSQKSKILERLTDRQVFIMGSDGNPTWKQLDLLPEKATVLFHFRRNETETVYFPTIKYAGEKVNFQFQNAFIVCDEPAWMVLNDKLYSFAKEVDGKKLRPFLNRSNIIIPKSVEETYYQKFVAPLIASFDVYAKGFEIQSEGYAPKPLLLLTEFHTAKQTALSLFDEGSNVAVAEEEDGESQILFDLSFRYGHATFKASETGAPVSVSLEKSNGSYIFHRIRRKPQLETENIEFLKRTGLELKHGRVLLPKAEAFTWLHEYSELIKESGFELQQSSNNGKKYFIGNSSINVQINENRDWFDIYATVRFGDYEMPFIKLRNLILRKKREFTLPNGEIAVIPEVWLTQYSELIAFSENHDGGDTVSIRKHHLALVAELNRENLAQVTISNKLEQLRTFEHLEDQPMPQGFVGELRPYQKAGYNWMHFLKKYGFGGCLADDMGLGKTSQALAMLQSQKESNPDQPSLVIVPTSLVYNWELEAKKFTPDLRVFTYIGTQRDKNVEQFNNYDVIITSYGIVRIDIEQLKKYFFNYVILDESQAIKNPGSNVAKAVRELHCRHRLVLTGTPIENSTLDLWSQMSFVNPGLLGNEQFFRNEFLTPIEKRNDDQKLRRLHAIIRPFVLRRHKSQVAKDLPEKIEHIQYCKMEPDQEEAYEEAKSYFRNKILENIDEKAMAKSQLLLIQGLTKLRQIANHPKMVDPSYAGSSGKLQDVLHRLETGISENHKILIFSQFVKHLNIIRHHLDKKDITYAYLDGQTKDRRGQVELFQESEDIPVFLISLKAGGLGLNLTAADYVFILDPWWNPAIEAQAVDRAHRIGQQQTVFTYKFITKNTVEEKILALQQHKMRLAGDLITTEESFVKSLSKEDILTLLD
ncbi:DEAD/DEAH box helicase [Cytophagaceae bacterium DM2B3-1]|uniref:DEAD/DEAH box helicase n=1 Tax=Xanthocytophaga flava TaxID=3048013 RepID=A0ABT7CDE4_9BACT|nr:DEAD/DEAH box helicase [Xanthocytophaga flavus]MDJ1491728.1 DEAD/DEAH box helicase [Xanthocytophaga flavus]